MLYSNIVLASIIAAASSTQLYDGHKVIRCLPETKVQLDTLNKYNQELDWDFWLEPRVKGGPVDILISSKNKLDVDSKMAALGVPCSVMIEDVQKLIDDQKKEFSAGSSDYYKSYHTYQDVYAYVNALASEFPKYASVSTFGQTYEGRDMILLTLSTNPSAGKKKIWLDAGLHSREWITVPTVTYIAETILRGYGTADGASSTYLLDTFDFLISPVLNVDGYDYTWNSDRMWRKTRAPNARSNCVGTDPNRNFNYHWGDGGSSVNPCSDTYMGPSAASSIEVQHIQNYLSSNNGTIVGFQNFHAYSQLWMSPWGYTYALPADYEDQNALSKNAVDAIYATHQKTYDYGPIANTIYVASGNSVDYAYGVCGIKYSYTAELRDTGQFGFLLPPDQIIPQAEEAFSAVLAMAKYIDLNP